MLLSWTLLLSTVLAKEYTKGQDVPITISNISPGGNPESGNQYLYPVDYFDDTLDLCYGDKWVDPKSENPFDNSKYPKSDHIAAKDSIFSDHLSYGPRTITANVKEEVTCSQVCFREYNTVNASKLNELVENDYRLNFFVDGMPVGKELYDYHSNRFYISNNVPLGYKDINHVYHIYNHWQFIIYYTDSGLDRYNVVKAVMQQRSIKRSKEHDNQCQVFPPQTLRLKPDISNKVIFTYDVVWKELDHEAGNHHNWHNRFDVYRHSLVNRKLDGVQNIIFTLLVGVLVAYGNHYVSATRQHRVGDDELLGLQSLKNDVFRKPAGLTFLSACVGTGFQFLAVAGLTLVGLILNTVSIVVPNQIKHTFFYLMIITSALQSYIATKVYINFHPSQAMVSNPEFFVRDHKKIVLVNAVFAPLMFFAVNCVLNNAYKSADSPKYLSMHTMVALVCRYLFIYVPLSCLGSVVALKKSVSYFEPNSSAKVSMIEKAVLTESIPVFNRSFVSTAVASVFPFTILCNRLDLIWYSILYNNLYFGFWNYLITVVLACAASVAISSIMTINSLNYGNWKWQWPAIQSGLITGLYSFVYGFKLLKWNKFGDWSSFVIFVCENLLVSLMIGLTLAGVNFFYTWRLVKRIF